MARRSPQDTPDSVDEFIVTFITAQSSFSNWSAHQLDVWGRTFPTVEHAYHFKKFEHADRAWAERIATAKSAYAAKQLAHSKPIDHTTWNAIRESVMLELLRAKLAQHADVRQALLETGGSVIAEVGNDADDFWGYGPNGLGQNTLGKLWMYLRGTLVKRD
jgi:ribA/ribD-fused uncharacterized protein